MRTKGFDIRFVSFCLILCAGLLTSCKSKKAISDGAVDASLSARKIIQNHYSNALDFETMSGKVKID